MMPIHLTRCIHTEQVAKQPAAPRNEELVALGTTVRDYLSKSPPHITFTQRAAMRMMETCGDCNQRAGTRGSLSITNTKSGATIGFPIIAIHALADHGSAHYNGEYHKGDVDTELLKRVLK